MRNRQGAALAMALLLVVILNCILVGTLHLAAQERRISANSARVLQLRTTAESVARHTLRSWAETIDTLGIGAHITLGAPAAGIEVERVGAFLFLVRAEARETAPGAGRATAQILAVPPPFPPGSPALTAPLSAGSRVRVAATGEIRAASGLSCPGAATSPHTVLAGTPLDVTVDPGGQLDAPTGPLPSRPLHAAFARITTLAPARVHAADTVITSSARGVLIVDGNVRLAAGARFHGLILVRGSVDVAAGAIVHGAVHAGGDATVAGAILFEPCTVRAELQGTRLERARPVATRDWVPSF